MTSSWQTVLIKCKREPWVVPIILTFVRIFICFLPQTAYLHPDEFFQSTDIVGGNYFNSKIEPVWEFKTDKPIRCMLIPNLLNTIAFRLIDLLTPKHTQPSAYLLIAVPRFIYTLTTFIIDFCLYKLCQYYSSRGLWYLPISVIFQSSFICLACATRTLSNTPEIVLFSLLLVVVCQTIRPTFRILFVTPNRSLPVNECIKTSKQLASSTLVGILVTLGTFNRPTFPCFALVPCIYWILQSMKKNSYNTSLTFKRVIVPISLSAGFTAILISAYDTVYYQKDYKTLENLCKYLTNYQFNEFYLELKDNWILTPYNFINYNTNVNNLSKYGLHMPYTHMLVNVPMAFNILGFIFYIKLIRLVRGSGIYRLIFSTHRMYALMFLTTLTSLILLSFIPHQEFRFLSPLIVPLVYSYAFNIYTSNKLLPLWLFINFILIYFYTSIHQSGVLKASLDLDKILKSHQVREFKFSDEDPLEIINVLAFRCYLVPSYQWNIKSGDSRFEFDLQDTFVSFNSSLNEKLENIVDRQANNLNQINQIYLMLPRLYEEILLFELKSKFSIDSDRLKVIKHYMMHYSGEDFWQSLLHLKQNYYLNGWSKAFGFSLYKLNLSENV